MFHKSCYAPRIVSCLCFEDLSVREISPSAGANPTPRAWLNSLGSRNTSAVGHTFGFGLYIDIDHGCVVLQDVLRQYIVLPLPDVLKIYLQSESGECIQSITGEKLDGCMKQVCQCGTLY